MTFHRFAALATCHQSKAAFSGLRINLDVAFAFDGDKSPAEIGVEPPHSKAYGADRTAF